MEEEKEAENAAFSNISALTSFQMRKEGKRKRG